MPKYDFRITAIIQTLENGSHIAEALFFFEVSRYGADANRLREALKKNASRIIEESPTIALHMRRGAGTPELGSCEFLLDAPHKSTAWRKPVSLNFDLVRWQHGDEACIAYIPALGIEVTARDPDELERIVPEQIHSFLLRTRRSVSLGNLVWLQRSRMILLDQSSFAANILTPRQLAARDESEESKKSVLEEIATDLTRETLPEAYEMDETVARIAETFTGRNPRSVLLVGPSGAGKTAAVYELVRRRQEFRMSRTSFWATSGSRLVAGMSGFGMWQERCGQLWREASKEKAILHLGNLLELMEVGKSESSSQGIAAFFRPYISRGDMLAIAECSPEQLPIIERNDPHLLDAFFQIRIEEPSVEKGKIILLNYAVQSDNRKGAPIEIEGIETLDRLHRRYTSYSAYPGRPVRFLKNLLQDREAPKSFSSSDVIRSFSDETGLPLFLLDPSVKLDLEHTAEWFTERVIGQPEAVSLIVDMLATVNAGLARPGKPIASLLFIGPTGAGKTEMARSLAEFLFRDKNRMTRFDMSEYSNSISVGRLIGGVWGEEGLLTSKVREQPFAVILLDEFEKAHPSFFDLLLQALGEGRLTDSSGRVADFSNSVVIMTSNLGAQSFRSDGLGFGRESDPSAKAREHFLNEVRAFVRPEFFNRIDRIVPFAPLNPETVLRIAQREIERLKDRDGILYRGISLKVSDEVAGYLARKGYDARYGARPLKRAVERELLVPLAEGFNRQAGEAALSANVWVDGDNLAVTVLPRADESGRPLSTSVSGSGLGEIASRVAELRRNIHALERNAAVLELQNEIVRLEWLQTRLAVSKMWPKDEETERLARLPNMKRGVESLKSLAEKVCALEDETLYALYGKAQEDKIRLTDELSAALKEWKDLLLSTYALQFPKPDYITLALYGENLRWLFELSRAYFEMAAREYADVGAFAFAARKQKDDRTEKVETLNLLGRATIRQRINKPEDFLREPRQGVVGIALGIGAPFAYPRYESERGLHLLAENKQTHKCLAHMSDVSIAEYKPPAGIEKRGAIGQQEKRRAFSYEEMMVEDVALKKKFVWDRYDTREVMAMAIEQRLTEEIKSLLTDSSNDS